MMPAESNTPGQGRPSRERQGNDNLLSVLPGRSDLLKNAPQQRKAAKMGHRGPNSSCHTHNALHALSHSLLQPCRSKILLRSHKPV